MSRHYRHRRISKRTNIIVTVVLLLCLVGFLGFVFLTEYKEDQQAKERSREIMAENQAEKEAMRLSVEEDALNTTEDSYLFDLLSVQSGDCQADILLSASEFTENVKYTVETSMGISQVSCNVGTIVGSTDILVLQFEAYTDEGAIALEVSCGEVSHTVYVTETPRAVYLLFTGITDIDDVSIKNSSEYVSTHITNVNLINYGSETSVQSLKVGYYDLSEYDFVYVDSANSVIDESTSLVCDNDLLYSVNHRNGTLQIYQINDNNLTLLGELSGLGTARDLHLTEDKSALLITSRRNGVFIVSVSDPENPYTLSTHDSFEYCAGLDIIGGGYAFICSRWFGIEIVDISDLSNPTYVTKVQGENEYQDCYVDENGYLYVGVYNGKRVDIWDVSDLSNTRMVASVDTDGAAQGLEVHDGYLYVSTALNNSETSASLVSISEFSSGTGNGLEIYDVHDPENPVWCSTTKFDGRMNVNLNDIWGVSVSSDGKYAYVSNMYGGLYIYDVSDVTSPVLYKKVDVSASSDSENYKEYDADTYVFPYNASSETRGCVTHVAFSENQIWLSTFNMGIYCIDAGEMAASSESYDTDITVAEVVQNTTTIAGYTVTQYVTNSQVYAVEKYGDYLAVACGSEGIQVLTEDLEFVSGLVTSGPVKDIQIFNDYIFTAEGNAGMGIYTFDGTSIQRLSGYTDSLYNSCFGSIQLSADGNYVLAETTQNGFCILDISDIYNPYKIVQEGEYTVGLIYYRSICNGLVDGKYFSIAGGTNYVVFSADENGITNEMYDSNDIYGRSNGAVAYGDKCIIIGKNGYYYYDYSTNELSERVKITDVTFEGKPSAYDNLLVISNEGTGHVMFVDITDLDNPVLLNEFDVDGNPDVALITEEYILLPCRYGGLLKFVSD